MSLLSRFNAWFSARQEGGGVSTRLNEDASELSTQHLPNATAPSFRRRYLEAITKTSADSKPTVYTLDPTIQLLVIPNRNKADPEKRTQLNPA